MRIALLLALAAAAAACSKPQPSPDYQEARRRHAAILQQSPLDAYEQPAMATVLELLERVPRESLDAAAAAELRQHILGERQALADQAARRARLLEGAATPTGDVPTAGSAGGLSGVAAPAEAGPGTAEPRPPSELASGTSLADFQRSRGPCFEAKAPARLLRDGKPLEGEAWALRDDPACRKQNPGEVGRLVVFAGGKLVEVAEAAAAKAQPMQKTIEGTRRPDGTVALPEGTKLPPGATVKWDPPPTSAAPPATR